jgi:hypothetical protein
MYLPGFDSPFWAFGIGTALLLLGLAYGEWRAGRLLQRERARVDAATLETQRREVEPEHNPRWVRYVLDYQSRVRPRNSAADFPVALVPASWWGTG